MIAGTSLIIFGIALDLLGSLFLAINYFLGDDKISAIHASSRAASAECAEETTIPIKGPKSTRNLGLSYTTPLQAWWAIFSAGLTRR